MSISNQAWEGEAREGKAQEREAREGVAWDVEAVEGKAWKGESFGSKSFKVRKLEGVKEKEEVKSEFSWVCGQSNECEVVYNRIVMVLWVCR